MTDSNFDRTSAPTDYPLVSVLFVTYKRIDLLGEAVHGLLKNTSYPRLELVIADDGSGPEIQAEIRTLPVDVLCSVRRRIADWEPTTITGSMHCTGQVHPDDSG